MSVGETKFCKKCKKVIKIDNFYKTNWIEKYQDGYLDECKQCVTLMVDNWNPDTFKPILQECDVPYIPEEWDKLLLTYGKDRSKVTGLTIVGRYLGKMKLKQYADFRWKDNEFLQQMNDHKTEEAMKRQGYGAAEIAQVINENRYITDEGSGIVPTPVMSSQNPEPAHSFEPVEDDFDQDLTDDDKKYLKLKWGKAYKPSEWVQLEQLYQDMMQSYDITAAGDINSLKLACKASLKANQLLDIGDIDGAQKMSKVYDGLMKSGKWTAQQNKAEGTEIVDSIGEICALCETDGYIERYYIAQPQDQADKIIIDNQQFLTNLVTEEMGLGNLIELAVKHIQDEKESILEAGENAEKLEKSDDMFNYDKPVVEDKDFEDFYDFQEEEAESDRAFYESLLEEDSE